MSGSATRYYRIGLHWLQALCSDFTFASTKRTDVSGRRWTTQFSDARTDVISAVVGQSSPQWSPRARTDVSGSRWTLDPTHAPTCNRHSRSEHHFARVLYRQRNNITLHPHWHAWHPVAVVRKRHLLRTLISVMTHVSAFCQLVKESSP